MGAGRPAALNQAGWRGRQGSPTRLGSEPADARATGTRSDPVASTEQQREVPGLDFRLARSADGPVNAAGQWLLNLFNLRQFPRAFEERFLRSIKTEDQKEALAGGRYPVLFEADRRGRPEIDVD